MRLQFFTVPVFSIHPAEDELNRFLASHRVVAIEKHLVNTGQQSVWAVCVTFLEGQDSRPPSTRGRIDYRELLPEADFRVYARLRVLRKEIATEEKVPPYAILNNEQLAFMVRGRMTTKAQLSSVSGIGPARLERWGTRFLEILNTAYPREPPNPEREDGADNDAS